MNFVDKIQNKKAHNEDDHQFYHLLENTRNSLSFLSFFLLLYWLSFHLVIFITFFVFCFCFYLTPFFVSYHLISFVYLLSKFVYFVHRSCSNNTGRPQKLQLNFCYCYYLTAVHQELLWSKMIKFTATTTYKMSNAMFVETSYLGCCFCKTVLLLHFLPPPTTNLPKLILSTSKKCVATAVFVTFSVAVQLQAASHVWT